MIKYAPCFSMYCFGHQHECMVMVVVVFFICGIVLLVHLANADEMPQILWNDNVKQSKTEEKQMETEWNHHTY